MQIILFVVEPHMDCWCCKSVGILYDVFVYLSLCDAIHLQ